VATLVLAAKANFGRCFLYAAATLFSGGATMISKLFLEEEGQTLVEYGLLISLLALVVIAAVSLFGKGVAGMWGNNSNKYPDPPQ
jgi:pilus assembly protein Flp/PilA